jgi:hypothetical protein
LPNQWVAHVDDLLQRRPEQVQLPVIARLRHLDRPMPNGWGIESESARERNPKSPETESPTLLSCKTGYFSASTNPFTSTA